MVGRFGIALSHSVRNPNGPRMPSSRHWKKANAIACSPRPNCCETTAFISEQIVIFSDGWVDVHAVNIARLEMHWKAKPS